MGKEGMQAMASMAQQMGDMEAMAQDLASIQAGLSECQSQMSQMSSSMGQCSSPGMGACQNGMMSNGRFGEGDSSLAKGNGRFASCAHIRTPGEAPRLRAWLRASFRASRKWWGPTAARQARRAAAIA